MKFCITLAALLVTAVVASSAAQAPMFRATASDPQTLRIYSSLPLRAYSRFGGAQAPDALLGERLALAEAGGVAGGHPIRLVSMDNSSPATGWWEPGPTSSNARRAAMDGDAIAYLGEFNSGASAISIPILNEAGLLQVSPSNTYVGLTRREGADIGEPDKWYPTGIRTYGRVAPADHLQAQAVVTLLASEHVRRVLLLEDQQVYGAGLARMVLHRALAHGIGVRGPFHVRRGHWRARIVRLVRRAKADAMFFGGITDNHAVGVFTTAHQSASGMTLIGADGVAERPFTRRLDRGTAQRTLITDPALPTSAYPGGKTFVEAFTARYGRPPNRYGIFGYEAMKVVLSAIDQAEGKRDATMRAFFATRNRDSVLGRYSIDSNGDTTLSTYGLWRVANGVMTFDHVIDSKEVSG